MSIGAGGVGIEAFEGVVEVAGFGHITELIAVEGGGAADNAVIFWIKFVGFFVGGGGAGPLGSAFVAESDGAVEEIAFEAEGSGVEEIVGGLSIFAGLKEDVTELEVDGRVVGIKGASVSEAKDGGSPVVGASVVGAEAEPGESIGVGAEFEGAGEFTSGVGEPAETEIGGAETDANAVMLAEAGGAFKAVVEVGGAGEIAGLEGLIRFFEEEERGGLAGTGGEEGEAEEGEEHGSSARHREALEGMPW